MKVELLNISKQFGAVLANQDVSLVVEAGSIMGLLGENGAGKSTLVKILSGFLRPDQGAIWLNGQPVAITTPADAIRLGIGMLHQDPLDFPALTVLENFLMGRSGCWFLQRQQALRQFCHLADQFNFHLEATVPVDSLTVGERQQLEILRLLSLGVNTLILDEPTTGISSAQKQALFAAVRQLAQQGKSILFVSHQLEDVNQLCDRITVMRQGKVIDTVTAPYPEAELVTLIFGRQLAPPAKPQTSQPAVALLVQNLTLSSDRLTIQIPSLQVKQGEVIGLAGLEGNGQQLLLQACAGLLSPATGSLVIDGVEMAHQPYHQFLEQGIGYSPADRLRDGLIAGLSIQEHVALKTASKGGWINWSEVRQRSQQAIALFTIRGAPQTRVEQLSGGNQQRTQLALLPVPLHLLLMEHPTRGLDIESAIWVWQQLLARCQGGTAILFSSADLNEILQYSDRVLVFSGGQVSQPIAVTDLSVERLGHMIGGQFNQPATSTPLPARGYGEG